MACGSRWCAWREALSRALLLGLAEGLKLGHAGNLLALYIPQGKQCISNCFQSACLTVVERRGCEALDSSVDAWSAQGKWAS